MMLMQCGQAVLKFVLIKGGCNDDKFYKFFFNKKRSYSL